MSLAWVSAGRAVAAGWFHRWQAKRVPAQRSILLNRHNIFIFPSQAGFSFLFVLLLLWLIATNYENNLVFALTFLLTGLFIVSILHTYANLAGVRISAMHAGTAFVGEDAAIELLVERSKQRPVENLILSWQEGATQIVNLMENSQEKVMLFFPSHQRGWCSPGRLRIQTYYPLGLLRAWASLDLATEALVYPKPIALRGLPRIQGVEGEGQPSQQPGAEDFYGFKAYQEGDSLRHVAWKQFARERGLLHKEFTATTDRHLWLDWAYLDGLALEDRLSCLCYWVLDAARQQQDFGLLLPGIRVEPGKGTAHRDLLLRHLALFRQRSNKAERAR